jgi:hypothetical protein
MTGKEKSVSHVSGIKRNLCVRNGPSVTHVSGLDTLSAGDPGWIRTSDLQLRRLLLYPLSYGAISMPYQNNYQSPSHHNKAAYRKSCTVEFFTQDLL